MLDDLTKTVSLPVECRDGVWCMQDGSPFPKTRKSAVANLVIDILDLLDEEDRERLGAVITVDFLPKGTMLFARVRSDVPEALSKHVETRKLDAIPTKFVKFVLVEDLKLGLRVNKLGTLNSCKCKVPCLDVETNSVNETYTRISTAFEPARRSHTANVFQEVFYCDSDWMRPLKELRYTVEQQYAAQEAEKNNQPK